jgi:enterochelin esterase-like enzyme
MGSKANTKKVRIDHFLQFSPFLQREVAFDCYVPATPPSDGPARLLILNDGQDMKEMGLEQILESLFRNKAIRLYVVAIHAGPQRRQEYGTAGYVDFQGRGCKADLYSRFMIKELVPFVQQQYHLHFDKKAIAGFSLGGLSALDIAWNHPGDFQSVGIFSGSLWWRSRDIGNGYKEESDRIMHRQIREGNFDPSLKFFLQCGTNDEEADRNANGVIDSIDDTEALIEALEKKGYVKGQQIEYSLVKGGKHDLATWAGVMPQFLEWMSADA